MKQDLRPNWIWNPSISTQPIKGCTTPTGTTPPTLYEQQYGFFYVAQESEQWKSCEAGPTVFGPHPKRLEWLTICRCHNKDSTFRLLSLFKTLNVGPAGIWTRDLPLDRQALIQLN